MKASRPNRPAPAPAPVASSRRWQFRLIALLAVPVALFALIELALRVSEFGYPTQFFRPLEIKGRASWVENDRFAFRFFPRSLARRPPPVVLPAEKSAAGFRIFVFGESAAMGDPDPSFSFSRMLEVLLRKRFPGTRFEVINTAFTAINSHAILPIVRECAGLGGDLWILYMGNNEVAGPFGPATVFGARAQALPLVRANLALKELKTGQAMDELLSRWGPRSASSNSWTGLQMFAGQQIPLDDPRLERVYRHFERNVEDILRAGEQAGVPVLVGSVGSNLRDFPPFASAHGKLLDATQLAAWEKSFQAGLTAEATNTLDAAFAHYMAAAEIDGGFADLQFRLGRCYLARTNLIAARQAFERARDLDTMRFRCDSRLNGVLAELSRRVANRNVTFVDTAEALARRSIGGIPGDEIFFDHVHLTFEGNFHLASAFADEVGKLLPPAKRQQDAGQWVAMEECSRELAFNDWSRRQLVQSMRQRLGEAPFTNQWIHPQRQQKYHDAIQALSARELDALAEAEFMHRDALTRAPEDYFLHENFGKVLMARGDADGALVQFTETSHLLPHSATAAYNLGLVFLARGKGEEALQQFGRALTLRGEYAEAHNGVGQALTQLGRTNEAVASFSRALDLKRDFADPLLNLGQLWQSQGEMEKARECFGRAIELQPHSASAHLRLGNLATQQGDLLQASKHFADAVRLQPESAFAQFINAVRLNPENAIAHFHLANALAAQGQPAEAIRSLQKAIELNPSLWQARYLLGVEMATQNNLGEAEFQFTETVRLRPDFALGHLNLGVALARRQKWSEALAEFQEVLRLEPANKQAHQYVNTIRGMARPN